MSIVLSSPRIVASVIFIILLIYFIVMPSYVPEDLDPLRNDATFSGNGLALTNEERYVLVIDAGSSGSRVHLYKWKWPTLPKNVNPSDLPYSQRLPLIAEVMVPDSLPKKTSPGLSSFEVLPFAEISSKLDAYVTPLFDEVARHIPASVRSTIPVYFYATAGMRLVAESAKQNIMSKICDHIKSKGYSNLRECKTVRVISGADEGIFGWLAANYLLRKITQEDGATAAFLDMGGASAQIAFELEDYSPSSSSENVTVIPFHTVDGESFEKFVFSTTFLGFGANEARERYLDYLVKTQYTIGAVPSKDVEITLSDPCTPKSLNAKEISDDGHKVAVSGSGNYDECLKTIKNILEKEKGCTKSPCMFNGVHKPVDIATLNELVGVSEYWYSTNAFESAEKYSFKDFERKTKEFCNKSWDEAKTMYPHEEESRKQVQCFKSVWMMTMLYDGFELPKEPNTDIDGDGIIDGVFEVVDKVKGVEVSWTPGVVLDHIMRYEPNPSDGTVIADTKSVEAEKSPYDRNIEDEKDTNEHALVYLFIILMLVGGVVFVKSSWFNENVLPSRNAVQTWMTSRSQYLSLSTPGGSRRFQDVELGNFASSSPSINRSPSMRMSSQANVARPF